MSYRDLRDLRDLPRATAHRALPAREETRPYGRSDGAPPSALLGMTTRVATAHRSARIYVASMLSTTPWNSPPPPYAEGATADLAEGAQYPALRAHKICCPSRICETEYAAGRLAPPRHAPSHTRVRHRTHEARTHTQHGTHSAQPPSTARHANTHAMPPPPPFRTSHH